MSRRRWSTRTRLRIHERDNGICYLCGMPVGHMGFELDHKIPIALGGNDDEENMSLICRPCHVIKSRRDVGDIAKAVRREASFLGAKAPSRNPLPCGRSSRWKKTLRGWVVERD